MCILVPGTFQLLPMSYVYTHPPWIPKTVSLILSFLLVPIATPSRTEMFLQDLQESFHNRMLILQILHTWLLVSETQSEWVLGPQWKAAQLSSPSSLITHTTYIPVAVFLSYNSNSLFTFFRWLNCEKISHTVVGFWFQHDSAVCGFFCGFFFSYFSFCKCIDVYKWFSALCRMAQGPVSVLESTGVKGLKTMPVYQSDWDMFGLFSRNQYDMSLCSRVLRAW